MQSTLFGYLGILLVLATLSSLQAAPSGSEKTQDKVQQQLVRVYPINEEQYERLQKLTNGKNVISEARLTSAGFTSVRDSLDSGWNSLLRIIGLTSTTRSDETKIDIDGQPLCVMKRSLSDAKEESKAASESEDDSVINCIVVLKDDPALEAQTAGLSNPNFAPYWYTESPLEASETAEQEQASPERASAAEPVPASVASATSAQATAVASAAPVPAVTKSKRKNKLQQKKRRTTLRQYPAGYPPLPGLPPPPPPPPPPAPYGAGYPYDNSYGFGGEGYGQAPYSPYGSYPAPAYPPSAIPPSSYPPTPYPASSYPTSPYPASPYPASPYPASPYPASPYPASTYPAPSSYPPSPYTPGAYPPASYPAPAPAPAPYGQYPFYDKVREGTVQYDEDEEDDESYEVYEADGDDSYESEYYD